MAKDASNSLQEIRNLWVSIPPYARPDSSGFMDRAKAIVKDSEMGKPADPDLISMTLVEIAQLPDEEKRFELAKALLSISGPVHFVGNPWEGNLNHPLLFALTAKDTRLIELYHHNGAALKQDDATAVGMQLGDGFWCLPDLIFPSMRDSADLYGFVYQVLNRRKETEEDMAATRKAIEAFAQWANPESLSSRITEAVSTWQAKRGNGFLWITGKRDYQIQTLAALVNIGLDIEQPIEHVKMNNAQEEEGRRSVYREAVACALSSATAPAAKPHKTPRL